MRTFTRLLGFLRPYRAGVLWSLVLAAAAMLFTVAIPWLTGRAIDQVAPGRQGRAARRSAALIAGAGVLRLGLTVARRLIAGRVSLGIEVDLRSACTRTCSRSSSAFFDRQQTGQLMSRSTVDLQSVRFFLGYGLIFLDAVGADDPRSPRWRCSSSTRCSRSSRSSPVPFVVVVATRYGLRSRPALQEVQQRIAELTAETEENISGVRVVKAFAREDAPARAVRARDRPRLRRSR